jgi:hypothetical protein
MQINMVFNLDFQMNSHADARGFGAPSNCQPCDSPDSMTRIAERMHMPGQYCRSANFFSVTRHCCRNPDDVASLPSLTEAPRANRCLAIALTTHGYPEFVS